MPAIPFYPLPRALFEEGAEDYINQWITRSINRWDDCYNFALNLHSQKRSFESGIPYELSHPRSQAPPSDH